MHTHGGVKVHLAKVRHSHLVTLLLQSFHCHIQDGAIEAIRVGMSKNDEDIPPHSKGYLVNVGSLMSRQLQISGCQRSRLRQRTTTVGSSTVSYTLTYSYMAGEVCKSPGKQAETTPAWHVGSDCCDRVDTREVMLKVPLQQVPVLWPTTIFSQ